MNAVKEMSGQSEKSHFSALRDESAAYSQNLFCEVRKDSQVCLINRNGMEA